MPYTGASSPFWKGDVWIVGGGASACAFDLSRLDGQKVLSVNDHYFRLRPGAASSDRGSLAAVFSLDSNFVRGRRDFLSTYAGERYVALPPGSFPELEDIPGVNYLTLSFADGLSENPREVCGCNSGHGALNLAFHKGATVIHLVGFDMDPADDPQYRFWAERFRAAASVLWRCNVAVINHNLNSFIDAFPKAA